MTQSKYSFERSELRALQNLCNGDNELFLNSLADMIGQRDEKIDSLCEDLSLCNARIRELERNDLEPIWKFGD